MRGLHYSFGLVAAILYSQATATTPPPKALLSEVQRLIGKIPSRTEKTIVLLAYAQAQERVGDRAGALKSLRLGWSIHQAGPIQPHAKREVIDPQTLFEFGDLATLPTSYAFEFVVAGDLADARSAAMSIGDSPLADVFRDDLGHKLQVKYPQAVAFVTLTDRQKEDRIARKQKILVGLAAIRAEADLSKRTWDLRNAADQLTRLDGLAEALPLLREAAAASDQLTDPKWRAIYDTEIADVDLSAGAKSAAKDLVAKAEIAARLVADRKQQLEARFYIEQTKRSMGVPNEFDKIMRERDSSASPKPVVAPAVTPLNGGSSQPYDLLAAAGRLIASGDIVAAKKALHKVKDPADGDGSWLVYAAEKQIQLGDRESARQNLALAAKRFIAKLRPQPYVDHEGISLLRKIAEDQKAAGDKPAALKTLLDGFHRLAGDQRWVKLAQLSMGTDAGGTSTITRDRQSPVLHAGALALANGGFYSEAVTMARTIQDPAHRAVAIAGVIRDGLPSFDSGR